MINRAEFCVLQDNDPKNKKFNELTITCHALTVSSFEYQSLKNVIIEN